MSTSQLKLLDTQKARKYELLLGGKSIETDTEMIEIIEIAKILIVVINMLHCSMKYRKSRYDEARNGKYKNT